MIRALCAVGLSALCGGGLWAVWPKVFGCSEPWDCRLDWYVLSLLVSGALCALVAGPRFKWWFLLWPAVSAVSQMIYVLIFLEAGPLFLVGAGLIGLFSLISVFGAGAVAVGYLVFARMGCRGRAS